MALAFSKVRHGVDHNRRYTEADVTFDNSYPTGGEAVSLASIGLNWVSRVQIVFDAWPDGATVTTATHGRQVVPDISTPTAPKLKVYTANDTEATNTSDQSQVVQRLRFYGP